MALEAQLLSGLEPDVAAQAPITTAAFDGLRVVLARQITAQYEAAVGGTAAFVDKALADAYYSPFDNIEAVADSGIGTAGDAEVHSDSHSEANLPSAPDSTPKPAVEAPALNGQATALKLHLPDVDVVEASPADSEGAAPQTPERQAIIARVARRIGKVASETLRVTKRATQLTAMTVGGLTLAGMVVASPAVAVHAAINAPRDIVAGEHQISAVEYQRDDGGAVVSQFSTAYQKDPQAYFPIISQFTKQPLEHGIQFGKGLYEAGAAVALPLVSIAAGLWGYRRFGRRQARRTDTTADNGQLAMLYAMLDGAR